jgi:putative ABC transport system permease protein
MFLALAEIRRSKARFALLAGAIALLAFLILFQQAIQSSLLRSLSGGVRNQTAPVLVFNVDGRRFLQGSSITPAEQTAIEGLAQVGSTAPIRQGTFPVLVDGGTEATSVLGFDDSALGGPTDLTDGRLPDAPGEVLMNRADEAFGFELGSVVQVQPTGLELTIVGVADDVGLNGLPTLFTTTDTYLDVLRTRNPDAGLPPPNAIGLDPSAGSTQAEMIAAVNALGDDLDAVTRATAADDNPATESINQSFRVVLALFGVVVPLVTGLFFLILTTQKSASLTLLRAIGAPAGRLVQALLVQVVIVLAAGLGLAALLYTVATRQQLDNLVLQPELGALLFWIGVLSVLGVVSALTSARRVLAVDPIVATTGAAR